MRTLLASLALLVAAPAAAHADGFLEFAGGIAQPIAEDEYEDAFDTHLQFGVRAGSIGDASGRTALGFELGFNYSPLNDEIPIDNVSVHRFRFTGGLRLQQPVADNAVLVARLAAGIQHVRASWELIGIEESLDDTGLVIDPGLGILAGAGDISLGAFVGMPVAFVDETEGFVDLDFTTVDLDLLFVLSTAL